PDGGGGVRLRSGGGGVRDLGGACTGGAEAVADHDDLGDFVDEDDGGKAQRAGDREREQHDDDREGQDDVLVDDRPSAFRVLQGLWDEAQVVAGERDVGGLDRGIGAGGAHRD